MRFTSRLRNVGGSLIITVPKEIVDSLKLKAGDLRDFKIFKIGESNV